MSIPGDTGKTVKVTPINLYKLWTLGPQPHSASSCLLWTSQGFTAIHFAAQRGKLACLQVLVEEYKFPVNLLTNNSQTPLHLVIHKDNTTVALPCIYYLLEKGAALNA